MKEYNTSCFPFIKDLESNSEFIIGDYASLRPDSVPYLEKDLYDGEWGVIPFIFFGEVIDSVCDKFPTTWNIINKIPGLVTASFSILSPGTEIHPHTGFTDKVLRVHLGLITPTNCALVVDNTEIKWEEGKCFVFDDTQEHSAYNRGSEDRVILILDIDKSQYEQR